MKDMRISVRSTEFFYVCTVRANFSVSLTQLAATWTVDYILRKDPAITQKDRISAATHKLQSGAQKRILQRFDDSLSHSC